MNLEVRLSVEDSPNSAGVAIDSIRCLKLALDNHLAGPIIEPAAYFQKHPPQQIEDREAHTLVEKFIQKYGHKQTVRKTSPKHTLSTSTVSLQANSSRK
jgi:myo-inositol-1-phosphate synthase